jgi:hypothetical protein
VARLERLSLDKHAVDGLLAGLNQRDDLRVGHPFRASSGIAFTVDSCEPVFF